MGYVLLGYVITAHVHAKRETMVGKSKEYPAQLLITGATSPSKAGAFPRAVPAEPSAPGARRETHQDESWDQLSRTMGVTALGVCCTL